MTINCDCSMTKALAGQSAKSSNGRFQKLSLKDKQGIASFVGKGEQYSIKNASRIHLNLLSRRLDNYQKPENDSREEIGNDDSNQQKSYNIRSPPPQINYISPAKMVDLGRLQSPRTHHTKVPSNRLYVYRISPRQDIEIQAIKYPQKQLKRLNTFESVKNILSTHCESPPDLILKDVNQHPPAHKRSSTEQLVIVRQCSERSSPLLTNRNNLDDKSCFRLEVECNDTLLSIEGTVANELSTLGRLQPKYAVSTGDHLGKDYSIQSGYSSVIGRDGPIIMSQFIRKQSRIQPQFS